MRSTSNPLFGKVIYDILLHMSNDDSRIEQLKKRLYSNSETEGVPVQNRSKLPRHSVLVDKSWQAEPTEENPVIRPDFVKLNQYEDRSPLKKVLLFVFVLFFLALAFAGYIIFSGSNFVSNSNIDIRLIGPVTSPAGEELSLDIDITNRNKTDLLLADIVVSYPEGTRSASDKISPLLTDRVAVGTIKAGASTRITVKSILFGEQDVKKNINVALEYGIPGSSNIFVKDKQYPMFIGSSPITVNVEALREITPEQEADFKVLVKSNSASIIRGLILKIEYPFGFEFISSSPQTTGDSGTWVLGDVNPGEEREITLKGRIIGGENQERVFRFYTGTEDPSDKTSIGTIFVTNTATVALKKPFLGADISLDGKTSSTYVTYAGENVKGEITWQNNLNVPLNDVVIEARINGEMLDRLSIQGDRGFYRSVDNTILWDRTTLSELREVGPGQIGRLQFSFSPIDLTTKTGSELRRQEMTIDLTIRAKRFNEGDVPVEIVSNIARKVQIASNLDITTGALRTIGPFQNTGPIPPMPEVKSTYTIYVSVKNSFNSVKDAVYTATLPAYVEWLGTTFPDNTGVRYNADTRQITWSIGDIQAGTGYSSSLKEFAYQVTLLPSLSQIGSSPILVSGQKLVGRDNYTGTIVESKVQSADTKISTDPTYKFGDEKVGGQ